MIIDDFADYLTSQARAESAVLHEFMLRFQESSNDLHLFFEGDEDPSFYMPVVRARARGVVSWSYVCGGKPALAELRRYLVEKKYLLDRVLFFVDRDFDDLLGCQINPNPRTFITDPYSIENYLVGVDQAEIVLVDLSGLSRVDSDCETFLLSLDSLLDRCSQVILPFLAMSLAAREVGMKPNFNNVNLANVFVVDLQPDRIRRKDGAAQKCISAILPKDASVPLSRIIRWARHLRSLDTKLWFRGKYELWFFERLLLLFLDGLAAKRKAAKKKSIRIPASLREGRLFEALGGRINPIPSLESFLSGSISGGVSERIPETEN